MNKENNHNHWKTIENALSMASVIGPLGTCTCNEPLIKWRDNKCGWCQLQEAIHALDILQGHTAEALTQFRIDVEVEAEMPITQITTDLGLALADVAEALGITDHEDLLQVLGDEAYLAAYEDPIPYRLSRPPHHAVNLLLAKLREIEKWITAKREARAKLKTEAEPC